MKIIIKTPNFLGDTIMSTPAIELLRQEYGDAKFTIVCKRPSYAVFRDCSYVENIIVDDTKEGGNRVRRIFKLIKKIREQEYDLGVVFHNTLLDALMFKLSRVSKIIGYEKEGQKYILDFWERIERGRHYVNHYAHIVNAFLGYKYKKLPLMKLNAYVIDLIKRENNKPNVGFLLGGADDTLRYYPRDLGLELCSLLSQQDDFNIVFLGGDRDDVNHMIYERALNKMGKDVENFSAKTTTDEFIDLIYTIDLLVTVDTSALHIAAAVNTNFICLVGRSPNPMEVVKPKVDFGTYLFKGDDMIEDIDLIAQIKPDMIIEEIHKSLGKS